MTMQWLKASSRYSNGKESDDEYTAIVQKGNMMCSTTSNCSTIPNGAMVTMETCHQWITKETVLRSLQVSRELGAIHNGKITAVNFGPSEIRLLYKKTTV